MSFGDDDVSVRIGADSRPMRAGFRQAEGQLTGFEAKAIRAGAAIAKSAALASVAVVGIGAAMVRGAARSAVEIENLSKLAGTTAEDFQKLAIAADTVGVSQEKLADVLKDVNDKFGDFATTGQGPLKDFFDYIAPAVGVTADQFARLSGPEALQLYVDSLEKANVSQQQMTFYLEALASDTTALLPLLENGGRAFASLGAEAQKAGRIMSNEGVSNAANLDRELNEIVGTIRDNFNRALVENSDEILEMAEVITEQWIPALIEVSGFIIGVVGDVAKLIGKIGDAIGAIADFRAEAANMPQNLSVIDSDAPGARAEQHHFGPAWAGLDSGYAEAAGDYYTPGQTTGLPLHPGSNLSAPSRPVFQSPGSDDGESSGSGGGGGVIQGPTEADLEQLQSRFATQRELILAEYEQQLAELQAHRDAKRLTEEEANALEQQITQEHQDKLSEIERAAQQARVQQMSAALGDLAAMMQSENEKLFKIGQAAAIADAVVNGYSAAVAAWDKGMKAGGPPVAAAFTAASLAKTGGLISSIASATSSGSTASGTVTDVSTVTSEPTPRRLAEYEIQGTNVQGLGALIDDINDALDQGYEIKLQYAR